MMDRKKVTALVLALCLTVSMTACQEQTEAIYVQSVKDLSGYGGIAPGDRFAGMVVSENVAEISRDNEKTIEELLVREGDDVVEGQELFRYDMEQLQLTLDKQKLELEQLLGSIESYKNQIAELEEELKRVWKASDKLQYTVEIQSLEVDLKEAELNVKAKETEIARSEEILLNAVVVSPVTGRIQTISENGTDSYGTPLPYITIQQSGSYRVKGILGELQRGGIMEGVRLKIVSRTDENQVWYGTVSLVDYENPTQGSEYDMYYGSSTDPMTSSSKYPFYVELEDTQGLIQGQHVYMMPDVPEEEPALKLSSAFFMIEPDDTAWVWAESGRGRLEKRQVKLGEYDPMTDTYPVEEGLTEEDFIAFPSDELCREGVPTAHEVDAGEGGGY